MHAKTPTPIVRKMRFGTEDVPRYWHGNDPALTAFFNALSMMFPGGERFFIDSVRHYAPQISDPRLSEAVRRFIGQEANHRLEHARFNQFIQDCGYPAHHVEHLTEKSLAWVRENIPQRRQLAVTCAIEHITAVLADALLAREDSFAAMHPALADLWRWHAVEETEHKSVCFDVYQEVGGNYFERTSQMALETFFFIISVVMIVNRLSEIDGVGRAKTWRRILGYLFVSPGIGRRALWNLGTYYRPGFHPWQHDNRKLLSRAAARLSYEPPH